MSRAVRLRPEFVDFIPEQLTEGVLYISRRYKTASHLCCCGCGLKVVTPINPAKWQLSELPGGTISLRPSIGNWGFPCRSHYWIDRNQIRWATAMPPEAIAAVQARDRRDADLLAARSVGRLAAIRNTVARTWRRIAAKMKSWWR
jgi:Family of unknown function (DUF6527)